MSVLLRKERNAFAAEWLRSGEHQSSDMGGEELLSCRFFVIEESSWREVDLGDLPTQVRANEDPQVLDVLLDKLLDRVQVFLDGDLSEEQFRNDILWFGPEMAEEY